MWVARWVVVLLALGMIMPYSGAVGAKPMIGVGDFWEYDVTADLNDASAVLNDTSLLALPSVNLSGIARLEISNVTLYSECSALCIGGGSIELLRGKVNMSLSVLALGVTVGSITLNASIWFSSVSTFDVTGFEWAMNMSIGIPESGDQPSYSSSGWAGLSPAFDFYPGNHTMETGSNWSNNCSLSTYMWRNGLNGSQEPHSNTAPALSTFKVVETGVPVTVPAGKFSCSKIQVEGLEGSTPFYMYYSDKAHFYVKMTYGNDSGSMTASLRDYSSSGGAANAGEMAMIVGGISVILVAAVVIAILLLRRRGGRVPAQSAAPAQSGLGQRGHDPQWPPPNQPGPPGPPGPPVGGAR